MNLDETRFSYAIGKVFGLEGGLSDNPHDSGQITSFGISLTFLQNNKINGDGNHCDHPTADIIKSLTHDQAKNLYKTYFWDKYKLNQINALTIASNTLNIAVLMGGNEAILLMQKALNSLHPLKIIEDGLIGTHTLYAINTTDPIELNSAFKEECIKRIEFLCTRNPDLEVFKKGWLNRINSL